MHQAVATFLTCRVADGHKQRLTEHFSCAKEAFSRQLCSLLPQVRAVIASHSMNFSVFMVNDFVHEPHEDNSIQDFK